MRLNLAPIVPLFHMLMGDDFRENKNYPAAVILVPNKELCLQMHRMAMEVYSAIDPEVRNVGVGVETSVTGYWPFEDDSCPHILICTPAFVGKFLRGPHVLDEDLFRSIRHCVMDEADMLLEGSYLKDIEKIVDAFKVTRRRMIQMGEIQVHTSTVQYILSAATLPSVGMRSIEKYIEERFPRAKWISNAHLHKHHPRILQSFHYLPHSSHLPGEEFLTDQRLNIIIHALFNREIPSNSSIAVDFLEKLPRDEDGLVQPDDSTMIFVNTAEVATELAEALRRHRIRCSEYHKLQPLIEKQQELLKFRENEVKVLVCTDHAARGLDIPNVRHVIQAEFAENVVQHLHRIGRASRAGALGRTTSIVGNIDIS